MIRLDHWILATAATLALLAAGALLDGPSDIEFEQAVQTDLQDAIDQARRDAPTVRLELARLEAEQAPAAALPRYALLEKPQ